MEKSIKKSFEVTLKFNEAEAQWLRDVIRNPHIPAEEETLENRGFRQELWDALSEALNYIGDPK